VIDHLIKSNTTKSNIGLAYVYCDYRDQKEQTTKHILGSIIKQLLRQLSTIPEDITELWHKHQDGKTLKFDAIADTLRTTSKLFNQTYICLDALDECQDFHELLNFFQKSSPTIRLFCTSRNHVLPFFRKNFEHAQTIRIEAKESDIRILVQEKITEDRGKDPDLMDEKLEQEILRIFSVLARGMFVATEYTKSRSFC
jgi:hypothetical protein